MTVERSEFEAFRKLAKLWDELRFTAETPRYEDFALGNLSDLHPHIALFAVGKQGMRLIRAGEAFCALTGVAAPLDWSDVPLNFSAALQEGVNRAAQAARPELELVRRIEAGAVGVCEIIFLPTLWRDETLIVAAAKARPKCLNLLETMYRATADGILIVTPARRAGSIDFQIISLNGAAANLLGVSEQGAAWRMLSEILTPRQTAALFRRLIPLREGQSLPDFELEKGESDADRPHLCVSAVCVGDLVALTLSDVSNLREREESVRRLFDSNPVPHWIYDAETLRILYVNEAALIRYEYDRDAMLALTLLDLHPEEDADKVHAAAQRRFAKYGERSDTTHVSASKRRLDMLVYKRDIDFEGRPCVLATMVDMTEQRAAERRIQHLALHDPLTGLPNRTLFREKLENALRVVEDTPPTVALHYLDLDHFKLVNDTLGHAAGDELLRLVIGRILDRLPLDASVARLGGDEFAIIQRSVRKPDDAAQLAASLVRGVAAPFSIGGQDVQVGLSVGIALGAAGVDTAEELLRKSDIALYRAKTNGRQTHAFFENGMDAQIQARRELENDLRRALAQNELYLVYQPLCEASRGQIIGCEALIRWRHPTRGLISPVDFIPLAEETGQILQIGDWVLRQACLEAASWPDHVRIAVNLSPVQFRMPGIVATIRKALAMSKLPAHRLEIEITENVIMAASATNIEVLRELRELGVSIALDDFGTGYSSLSYLHAFPLDKIKVDRSFVSNLAKNSDSQAIVRAIAALGRSLGVRTLAEGVETQDQLDCLRAEGYDEMQGYYFSPPKPADDVRALFFRTLAA